MYANGRSESFGVLDPTHRGSSNQKLVDTFGFLYQQCPLDLTANQAAILEIESALDELSQIFRQRTSANSQVMLRFPLCTFTFNLLEGVNQVIINRISPVDPSYVSRFLSQEDRRNLPSSRKTCGDREFPLLHIDLIGAKNVGVLNRGMNSQERRLLTPASYAVFERLFANATSLINQVASKEAGEMLIVSYEPGADLRAAERCGYKYVEPHHYDHNENAVTRAIGLIGTMECHAGISDETSLKIKRKAGDEIVMNYLADGFGAKYPFHDFRNSSNSRTLSLVIDEPPIQGLELLNSCNVYSSKQLAAILY